MSIHQGPILGLCHDDDEFQIFKKMDICYLLRECHVPVTYSVMIHCTHIYACTHVCTHSASALSHQQMYACILTHVHTHAAVHNAHKCKHTDLNVLYCIILGMMTNCVSLQTIPYVLDNENAGTQFFQNNAAK
jgi:hypothetical protein